MTTTANADPGDLVGPLGEHLCKALRALGQAGHPDEASRLAAKAWWVTREAAPEVAARINGTMHYLATLPEHETIPPERNPR